MSKKKLNMHPEHRKRIYKMDVGKRLQSAFGSLSRMFNLRDVKPASTNISNSLSAALPTLFVRFTSAIRLSVSQRTHGTLSCCAALIETANSLSQAKWAGRNRGGGKT